MYLPYVVFKEKKEERVVVEITLGEKKKGGVFILRVLRMFRIYDETVVYRKTR